MALQEYKLPFGRGFQTRALRTSVHTPFFDVKAQKIGNAQQTLAQPRIERMCEILSPPASAT